MENRGNHSKKLSRRYERILFIGISRSKNYQSSQVQEKRGERYSDDSFITFVL